MLKKSLIAVIGLILLSLSTAQAQTKGAALFQGQWWKIPPMTKNLNLTSEDTAKLEKAYQDFKARIKDYRSERSKLRQEMDQVFQAEPFDVDAARAANAKVQELRNRFDQDRFDYLVAIREIMGRDRYLTLKENFKSLHAMKKDKKMKLKKPTGPKQNTAPTPESEQEESESNN